jgi:hypothetical protein
VPYKSKEKRKEYKGLGCMSSYDQVIAYAKDNAVNWEEIRQRDIAILVKWQEKLMAEEAKNNDWDK